MSNFNETLKTIIIGISSLDRLTIQELAFSNEELLSFMRQIINADISELKLYRGESARTPSLLPSDFDKVYSVLELADMLLDDSSDTSLSSYSEGAIVEIIINSILSLRSRKRTAKKAARKRAALRQSTFDLANFAKFE